ncbi:MAG TPA: SCP2 sterol-binding domain-containing protein [Steroidobacteraceae bacterium]|nr:SCP2 sterol-binding domain-containing protein [Steroidobacteraceae bacterium]
MPATPAWLASIEAMLNRNIDAQSAASELVRRQLDGKSLQVEVEGLLRVRADACAGRLVLSRGAASGAGGDGAADAVISGSPSALLQLLNGGGRRTAASAARVGSAQVRGDAEVASAFRDLLSLARPDLEEELSRWIGDLPARRVGLLVRETLAWSRQFARSFGQNVAEYLQEESRDLVSKPELDEFLRGVDELREASDRAEARLKRLELRLPGGG